MSPLEKLYEHSRESILPLLRHHLPASLLVLGTILSPVSPAYELHVPIWSTIPPTADGSPVPIDSQGTIIATLPPLPGSQMRIFDTSESTQSPGGTDGAELEAARRRVIGALRTYVMEKDRTLAMIGGLHELWVEAAEKEIAGGEHRPVCAVWMPPVLGSGKEQRINLDVGEREGDVVEGYEADIGRECDVEDFSGGSDVARDSVYYSYRLPWATVIRSFSSSTSDKVDPFQEIWTASIDRAAPDLAAEDAAQSKVRPPACRVLTDADGCIGALSTTMGHRRKGLAQWVVREHIKSGRGLMGGGSEGQWASAVIFERNIASQKTFGGMGWKRAWGCSWVAVDRSGEYGDLAGGGTVKELRAGLRDTDLVTKNTLEGRGA